MTGARAARSRTASAALLGLLLGWGLACATPGASDSALVAPRELPPGGQPAGPAPLLLVSVEGLRAEFIEPYAKAPRAPVLSQLAREGVRVDALVGVTPPARYPAHATIVTGSYPEHHAVVADSLVGERGIRRSHRWHASGLAVEGLWQAAQSQGHSVAALGWPSTLGAAIDWLVPDVEPVRRGQSWLSVLDGAATPPLLESLSAALAKTAPGIPWPAAANRDSALVGLACEVVARKRPPAFVLLRLSQLAEAGERAGPGTPDELAALGSADRQLGRLVDCLAAAGRLASSALVITGDRAIAPVHTSVAPNVVLAQAGLLDPGPAAIAGEGEVRSWSAIAQPSESIALVYAKDESAAVDARRALELAASETGAFRILTAGSLQARRADPNAWFGLAAQPGFVFEARSRGLRLQPSAKRGAASSDGAQVGLVAWGVGLRPGVQVPLMHQVDIAPTLARLLGIRFAAGDGRPLVGALTLPLRDASAGR